MGYIEGMLSTHNMKEVMRKTRKDLVFEKGSSHKERGSCGENSTKDAWKSLKGLFCFVFT